MKLRLKLKCLRWEPGTVLNVPDDVTETHAVNLIGCDAAEWVEAEKVAPVIPNKAMKSADVKTKQHTAAQ